MSCKNCYGTQGFSKANRPGNDPVTCLLAARHHVMLRCRLLAPQLRARCGQACLIGACDGNSQLQRVELPAGVGKLRGRALPHRGYMRLLPPNHQRMRSWSAGLVTGARHEHAL